MVKIIIVTGIPGTGKTSVCNELLKLGVQSGKKITVMNFGTIMTSLSRERGRLLHRDKLRESNLFFQQDLQLEAAKTIIQQTEKMDGDVVIDTHMSIKTPEGFLAGLPFNILKILNPTIFVLIEAEVSEVLRRRLKDVTRNRDKVLEKEIAEELFFSRLMSASCAVLTNASVKIVKNPAEKQVEAAKEILKLL